jgi:hypothetical protein
MTFGRNFHNWIYDAYSIFIYETLSRLDIYNCKTSGHRTTVMVSALRCSGYLNKRTAQYDLQALLLEVSEKEGKPIWFLLISSQVQPSRKRSEAPYMHLQMAPNQGKKGKHEPLVLLCSNLKGAVDTVSWDSPVLFQLVPRRAFLLCVGKQVTLFLFSRTRIMGTEAIKEYNLQERFCAHLNERSRKICGS